MYETEEFFDNNGSSFKEILLTCLFSYYEKRFLYK